MLTACLSTTDCYLAQKHHGEVIVGSATEDVGFDHGVTPDAMATLAAGAVRAVPSLGRARVKRMWSGFRPGTPDELPILGPVDGVEGYLNACGHFRTGILTSPLTGLMIAEVASGPPSFPVEPFLYARLAHPGPPAASPVHTTPDGEAAFGVFSMVCEGCVETIEKALGALDGAREVTATVPRQEVRVRFDPAGSATTTWPSPSKPWASRRQGDYETMAHPSLTHPNIAVAHGGDRPSPSQLATTAVLLLSCPDQPGIEAAVSDFIYRHGGSDRRPVGRHPGDPHGAEPDPRPLRITVDHVCAALAQARPITSTIRST